MLRSELRFNSCCDLTTEGHVTDYSICLIKDEGHKFPIILLLLDEIKKYEDATNHHDLIETVS